MSLQVSLAHVDLLEEGRYVVEKARTHWLSKSRFVAGKQCERQLWWRVREPNAPELVPDADVAYRMEVGRNVGELARSYVPGGVLIGSELTYADRVIATQAAIHEGTPLIYEAAFFEDGVFVAVDILVRDGPGWNLIEVKSTTSVATHHIWDAAVQLHVLRRAGLRVPRVELMHLDRRCVAPHLHNLFVREDITSRAEKLVGTMGPDIAQLHAAIAGEMPAVEVGPHCHRPYPCPFASRCGANRDPEHVRALYRIGTRAAELEAVGVHRIDEIPDDHELPDVADRQRRAVKAGGLVVEPTLADALAPLVPPLAFLDFETVAPAIPKWAGTHPYEALPAQFSVDVVVGKDNEFEHHEFLALPGGDPRLALATALVAVVPRTGAIVAYNASFERRILLALGVAVPSLRTELEVLASRLIDLLPIVRDHVGHPAFEGRFGLKVVAGVLAPGVYDGLSVRDGASAARMLETLLFAPERVDDLAGARQALLSYCAADTRAMVTLWWALRRLAKERG
jgi:predicted RecB family nuclease